MIFWNKYDLFSKVWCYWFNFNNKSLINYCHCDKLILYFQKHYKLYFCVYYNINASKQNNYHLPQKFKYPVINLNILYGSFFYTISYDNVSFWLWIHLCNSKTLTRENKSWKLGNAWNCLPGTLSKTSAILSWSIINSTSAFFSSSSCPFWFHVNFFHHVLFYFILHLQW